MTVQRLEDVTIARGSCFNPRFVFENADKTIPDYSDYTAYFILSQYGFEDENVYSQQMQAEDKNIFFAILNTSDTAELIDETYTMKIVLVDENGNQYKYARGVLSVLNDTKQLEVSSI